MMSIQDAALKDSNFDDAAKFYPERWLNEDSNIRHDFASISFGYGPRRCLGQNIAEVMTTILTIKVIYILSIQRLWIGKLYWIFVVIL